ncbi:MAG TPA: hypothetical protein VNW29_05010 [Candidatus Sulfotelmatobacter sp.]|nr:hypothetical protein [Candidatus Sulfotelmatobacter sp.]
MKRKSITVKRKKTKRVLKKHHKIILMSAFGAMALIAPLWGSIYSQSSSHSGEITTKTEIKPCRTTTSTPCPTPLNTPINHVKYLSCTECSSKTLCFSASKKLAYCGGILNAAQTPSDVSCVSCPQIIKTPTITPSYHPVPSCFTRVLVNNTTKPEYTYRPCTNSK